MVKNFLIFLALLITTFGTVHAENIIQTRIHDEKIFQGESFLLIITATGKFTENDLDPRPLTTSFTVGDISFTYNEDKNQSIWRIPMICRNDGIQTIPGFLIKDNVSAPFPITVRRQHSISTRPELRNLINTEIKSNNVYVNETILIKTVINKTKNIEITSITAPTLEGANGQIHLIYENTKQKNTMGQETTTITRVYAASFREPGKYKINPLMVNGTYLFKNNNVTISNQNSQNTIVVSDPNKGGINSQRRLRFVQQNNPLEISVQNIDKQKNLLVADELKIVEKWEPQEDATLQVNEPIAHEIIFNAEGVSVADLPQPLIKATPQYKAYNDRIETMENYDPSTGKLTSKLILRQVYVPLRNMKLRFEPLEISWVKHNTEGQSSINLFRLTSPSFLIEGDTNEHYDLKNTNHTQTLLVVLLIVISILIIICIIYLLYLDNIISFAFITRWNEKRSARKYLIKNFDTTNARTAYQQIMNFARVYYGPKCTSFEKLPQYLKYQSYLDDISKILWDTHKTSQGTGYDGKEFSKVLKRFVKGK